MNFPRNNIPEKVQATDEEDGTPIPEPRMMSHTQDRNIMVQQNQTQALQERVSSPTISNSPQRQQQPVARPPLPTPPQAPPVQEPHSQYLVQPRPRDSKPQVQHPLPQFLHSSQIQNIIDSHPKSEEYTDVIRMLVLLDKGEQRLITFTSPEEACTIQEILEQVDVPFTKETPIQVSEANSNGVNYIVAVGNIPGLSLDPPVSFFLRIVEGQLAVCAICGYLSEDFNRCMRCKRKLPDNVKDVK